MSFFTKYQLDVEKKTIDYIIRAYELYIKDQNDPEIRDIFFAELLPAVDRPFPGNVENHFLCKCVSKFSYFYNKNFPEKISQKKAADILEKLKDYKKDLNKRTKRKD